MKDVKFKQKKGKSRFKKITPVIIGLSFVAFFIVPMQKVESNEATVGDLKYVLMEGNTAKVVGFSDDATNMTDVYLMSEIEYSGVIYDVTSVESNAFDSNDNIENVFIELGVSESDVLEIGDGAFRQCFSLDKFAFVSDTDLDGTFEPISNPQRANNRGLFIDGEGVLYNSQKTNLIMYPAGRTGDYTVNNGAVTIGKSAFRGIARGMTTGIRIDLANVETIEEEAFYEMNFSGNRLVIPKSVDLIKKDAFGLCNLAGGLEFESRESDLRLNENAFASCTNLRSVKLVGKMNIDSGAFANCTDLEEFTVDGMGTSDNYKRLGNYSSVGKDGILYNGDQTEILQYPAGKKDEEIEIVDSVTKLGIKSFFGNQYIKKIKLNNISEIDSYAFSESKVLEKVYFGANISEFGEYSESDEYGGNVFRNINNNSNNITGNNLTFYVSIGNFEVEEYVSEGEEGDDINLVYDLEHEFVNNSNGNDELLIKGVTENMIWELTRVILPKAIEKNGKTYITVLEEGAFDSNSTIEEVFIEKSDSNDDKLVIDDKVFRYCCSLKKFAFVTKNNKGTFDEEINSSGVSSRGLYIDKDGVLYSGDKKTLLIYPTAKVGGNTEYEIIDEATTVGKSAFRGVGREIEDGENRNLKVKLNNVETIEHDAFYEMDFNGLEFEIPETVEIIKKDAFGLCTGLDRLEFSNMNSDEDLKLEENAFTVCSGLRSVELITRMDIESGAFANCTDLSRISVIGNVREDEDGYKVLDHFAIDENGIIYSSDKKTILQYPAGRSGAIINIPDQVTILGVKSFFGNQDIEEIRLNNVEKIENYAFSESKVLEKVYFGENIETFGKDAFINILAPNTGHVTGTDELTFYVPNENSEAKEYAENIENLDNTENIERNIDVEVIESEEEDFITIEKVKNNLTNQYDSAKVTIRTSDGVNISRGYPKFMWVPKAYQAHYGDYDEYYTEYVDDNGTEFQDGIGISVEYDKPDKVEGEYRLFVLVKDISGKTTLKEEKGFVIDRFVTPPHVRYEWDTNGDLKVILEADEYIKVVDDSGWECEEPDVGNTRIKIFDKDNIPQSYSIRILDRANNEIYVDINPADAGTLEQPTLQQIIVELKNGITYHVGDKVVSRDIVVKAKYSNETEEVLNSDDYTIEDKVLVEGYNEIKISYNNKTVKLRINNVLSNSQEENPVITKITAIVKAGKTFKVGDDVSKDDLVVTAYYDDNTSAEITDFDISNGIDLVEGNNIITVSKDNKIVNVTIIAEKDDNNTNNDNTDNDDDNTDNDNTDKDDDNNNDNMDKDDNNITGKDPDSTQSDKVIPNTGIQKIALVGIIVVFSLGIVSFVKFRRIKMK